LAVSLFSSFRFLVIPVFRLFRLSGRSGYFPIIPINANKKQFKKDKRSAQFAYFLLFNKSSSNFVVLAETGYVFKQKLNVQKEKECLSA
jgi:hypothetical protein